MLGHLPRNSPVSESPDDPALVGFVQSVLPLPLVRLSFPEVLEFVENLLHVELGAGDGAVAAQGAGVAVAPDGHRILIQDAGEDSPDAGRTSQAGPEFKARSWVAS